MNEPEAAARVRAFLAAYAALKISAGDTLFAVPGGGPRLFVSDLRALATRPLVTPADTEWGEAALAVIAEYQDYARRTNPLDAEYDDCPEEAIRLWLAEKNGTLGIIRAEAAP